MLVPSYKEIDKKNPEYPRTLLKRIEKGIYKGANHKFVLNTIDQLWAYYNDQVAIYKRDKDANS